MIISRKVQGIPNLISYFNSVDYQVTEEVIIYLIECKELPHLKPFRNVIIFNLDHIDWWISQQKSES